MGMGAIGSTVLVLVGSTEAAQVARKKPPTMRPVLGGFLVGIALIGISNASDHLANLLCVLIVVGALVLHGPVIFNLAAQVSAVK